MATKLIYAALIAGTVLVCAFNETFAGVLVLFSALIAIAIMRDKIAREIYREEAAEEAERMAEQRYQDMVAHTHYHVEYRKYIGLGKGYK
jgi:hypothetical protein